jgi:8-hydroxy-5-deazaflavin:NADPH oxidoreductase
MTCILGSGDVAQQLGFGFLKLGHTVKLGTRSSGKLADWKSKAGNDASIGTFEEAAQFGEIILLATLWVGTEDAIRLAGPKNFDGKIVVDVTNPLDFTQGVPPRFSATPGNSGGERVQKWLPKAKVVKAFNTISAYIMCNPKREEGVPDLFIAGNDPLAKKEIAGFAEKWGWASVVDMGNIAQSIWLETFAMLWIHYGFKYNNWTHAFKLLRK